MLYSNKKEQSRKEADKVVDVNVNENHFEEHYYALG